MTKEEFIDKWEYLIPEFYHVELAEDLDSVIQQAIAEHEASQWKKYPENKPDKEGWYLLDDGTDVGMVYFDDRGFTFMGKSVRNPIAFRELPKPYQEGKPAKFNDTTSEPFDCNEFEIHVNTKWEGGER